VSEGYRSGEDGERDEALARFLRHAGTFDRIAKVPEELHEALNAAREIAFVEGWRAAREQVKAIGIDKVRAVLTHKARTNALNGTPEPVVDNPTARIETAEQGRPDQINGFTRPHSGATRQEANIGWLQPGEIGYCQAAALMELIDEEQNPQGQLWIDTRFPVRPDPDEGFVLRVTRAPEHFIIQGPKELHRLVRDAPPPRDSRVVMPAHWSDQ
jgi:hypothetical protein